MTTLNDTESTVVSVEKFSDRYCRLHLKTSWKEWMPGQFVMLSTPGKTTFIRRPFGIVSLEKGVLELCFKIVGEGTRALSKIREGDVLDVLGPLGNGFEIKKGSQHVLVAGGYGIAPIMGLARKLAREGTSSILFYGAKALSDLIFRDEVQSLCKDVFFATEDGSFGSKGFVTEVLKSKLNSDCTIYACGPEAMLKEIAKIAADKKVSAQVSLDRYMACGIGVCMGCICKKVDGTSVRACADGPVFDVGELLW